MKVIKMPEIPPPELSKTSCFWFFHDWDTWSKLLTRKCGYWTIFYQTRECKICKETQIKDIKKE